MPKRSARLIGVLPLMVVIGSPAAQAWPSCQSIFALTYPNSQREDLASCQSCDHWSDDEIKLNAYGGDLIANGANGADGTCTSVDFAAVLTKKAVESTDSNGDCTTNIVEIAASTQPGWCDTTMSTNCKHSADVPLNVPLDPDSNDADASSIANGTGDSDQCPA